MKKTRKKSKKPQKPLIKIAFLALLVVLMAGFVSLQQAAPAEKAISLKGMPQKKGFSLKKADSLDRKEILEENIRIMDADWNLVLEESETSKENFSRFVLERRRDQEKIILFENTYWAVGVHVYSVIVSPEDTPRRMIVQTTAGLYNLDFVLGIKEKEGSLVPLEALEIHGLNENVGPNRYISTLLIGFVDNNTVVGLTRTSEYTDAAETLKDETQLWEAAADDLNNRTVLKTYFHER